MCATGSGSGTISYSVTANNSPNTRSGFMVTDKAGQAMVQQNGSQAVCTYAISPSGSKTLTSDTQTLTVNVTTQPGCSWVTTGNNIAWVRIQSSTIGNGTNGNVVLSISANATTSNRTNAITVAGQPLTITQSKK